MTLHPSPKEGRLTAYRPLADINVTPLVDVMLVLLIIFMVTAPMLMAGLELNLPKAGAAQPVSTKAPIIVTVTKDGAYRVGDDPLGSDRLAEAVRARMGGDANRAVYVQGDRETIYGNVVAAIDLLMAAGIGKVIMIVERKSPSAASDALHAHPPGHLNP